MTWPSLTWVDCGDYAPCVLRDGHDGDHEVYDDATGHVTRVPRVNEEPVVSAEHDAEPGDKIREYLEASEAAATEGPMKRLRTEREIRDEVARIQVAMTTETMTNYRRVALTARQSALNWVLREPGPLDPEETN